MARISSLFSNLGRRQNPSSSHITTPEIRNRNLCSGTQIEAAAQERALGVINGADAAIHEESTVNPSDSGETLAENRATPFSEIAKEVCSVVQTRPRWQKTLAADFPAVSFTDPCVYNEILQQQGDLFLWLQFYSWLRSLGGFTFDPSLCNRMFYRLAEAKDVAKQFLDDSEFEVEPWFLELYVRCLSENELIDQILKAFERLEMIGCCASLETWNSALFCSVRMGRADVVWKLHEDMVRFGVETDVNTMGCLIEAFCLENNVMKGYQLLNQVLMTGHVPEKIVFDTLISSFGKNGRYGKMSAVLRKMIAGGHCPDMHTYHEIIRFCRGEMIGEGVRIFNELKNRGHVPDGVMYTTMIRNLCENKDVKSASELWFEMIKGGIIPNEYTYNVFISGLFKNGCVYEAEKLHREMLEQGLPETTVSFNTRIYGLCINNRVGEARMLLEEIKEDNLIDSVTYDSMIQGFSKKGKAAEAMYFLDELLKQGSEPSSSSLASLVEILCNDGCVKEAERMLLEMSEKGFNVGDEALSEIVYGVSMQGNFAEMNEWLHHMIQSRAKPKMVTFEKLIRCLCKAGRPDDALFVLHYMLKMGYLMRKGIYSSLVEALCQVNSQNVLTLLRSILEETRYGKFLEDSLEAGQQTEKLTPCSQDTYLDSQSSQDLQHMPLSEIISLKP